MVWSFVGHHKEVVVEGVRKLANVEITFRVDSDALRDLSPIFSHTY